MKSARTVLVLAGVVISYGAVIFYLLADAEPRRTVAFWHPAAGAPEQARAVDLEGRVDQTLPPADQVFRHQLTLVVGQPQVLAQTDLLVLAMGTYGTRPDLVGAEARLAPGGCLFRADAGDSLRDNEPLRLRKAGSCELLNAAPQTPGQLDIEISNRGAPKLAVWADESPAAPESALVWVKPQSGERPTIFPRGGYLPNVTVSARRHGEVAAYMWDLGDTGIQNLIGLLVFCGAVTGGGLLAFWRWRQPAALVLVFAGISGTYAVIVPPFQAPDEPNHFLSFTRAAERADLEADALRLANRDHFSRIKRRATEPFTAMDMTAPTAEAWPPHVYAYPPNRSLPATWIWRAAGHLIPAAWPAGLVLLALRFTNIIVFAFGIALTCRAVGTLPAAAAVGALLPLIFVPTLPFFVMHVSNYPVMILGLALQALAFNALLYCEASLKLGLVAGFGIALAGYAGWAGGAALAFWAPALLGLVSPKFWLAAANAAWRRWLAGAVVAYGAIAGAIHLAAHDAIDPVAQGASWAAGLLTGTHGAAAVTALICCGALVVTGADIRRLWLRRGIGVLVALGVLYSAVSTREVPNIEAPSPFISTSRYVFDCMRGFLASLGIGHADGQLSIDFWLGFGWLEAIPPRILFNVLRIAPIAGLAAWTLGLARRQPSPLSLRTLGALVGVIIYVAMLAFGYHTKLINLHGRYLVGPYLLTLVIAFANLGDYWRRKWPGTNFGALAIPVIMLSHLSIWLYLAHRYY